MKRPLVIGALVAAVFATLVSTGPAANAATACTFTTSGTNYRLNADCITDTTIVVPAGLTLDGRGKTITAVDPIGGHFLGAVVKSGGTTNSVKDLTVRFQLLDTTCETGAGLLRGILLDKASGSVMTSKVIGAARPGCQEGDGIVANNPGLDVGYVGPTTATIAHNTVTDAKRQGIWVEGDVTANMYRNNVVAAVSGPGSAGIYMANGAKGSVLDNTVSTTGDAGLLIDDSSGIVARRNVIGGQTVGIKVGSLCAPAGTADGNELNGNIISNVAYGIMLYAQTVNLVSTCDASANSNVVKYNKITSAIVPTGNGITIFTADDTILAPFDAEADGNQLLNNTISGFLVPIVDLGTNTTIVP